MPPAAEAGAKNTRSSVSAFDFLRIISSAAGGVYSHQTKEL